MMEKLRFLMHQCGHHDKDERYMAISDLRSVIDDLPVLEGPVQTQLREVILERLADASSDVQAIAVNCLCSMVEKFDPIQVVKIVAAINDISHIVVDTSISETHAEALRGILKHIPCDLGSQISGLLLPGILKTLSSEFRSDSFDRETQHERHWCLNLLQCLLDRFDGSTIGETNCESILEILLKQLGSDMDNSFLPNVVASFSHVCPSYLLSKLVQYIMTNISASLPSRSNRAILVFTLSNIARNSGPRLVQYTTTILPVLESISLLGAMIDFEDAKEDMVITRHHTLAILEILIKSGPKYVKPYSMRLLDLGISLIALDPNYDEDHTDQEMEEVEDDWGLEPDAASDDPGDTTWKVRLAALEMLQAWIECYQFRHDAQASFERLSGCLSARLTERDSTVQVQVCKTLATLIKTMGHLPQTDDSLQGFISRLPRAMQLLRPQMTSISPQVRRASAFVLAELISASGPRIAPDYPGIIPLVIAEIADRADVDVQLLGFECLQTMISSVGSDQLSLLNMSLVSETLVSAVVDYDSRHGNLLTAAFDTIVVLCRHFYHTEALPFSPALQPLFAAVQYDIRRMVDSKAIDSEAFSSGCCAFAMLVSCSGEAAQSSLTDAAQFFLSLTSAPVTCHVGAQSLITLAQSRVDRVPALLSPCSDQVLSTMLRLAAAPDTTSSDMPICLSVISTYLTLFADTISSPVVSQCLPVLVPLSGDTSLQSPVHLLCAILIDINRDRRLPLDSKLIGELVQRCMGVLFVADTQLRTVLHSSEKLLKSIARIHPDSTALFAKLTSLIELPQFPQASASPLGHTLATCIGARCVQLDGGALDKRVAELLQEVKYEENPLRRQLLVIVMGDICIQYPLQDHILEEIYAVTLDLSANRNDQVRCAASYALGKCIAANIPILLERMVVELKQCDPQRNLFLLHALKEVFVISKANDISVSHADQVFRILMKQAESLDEGVRVMISECIGKLLVLAPGRLGPRVIPGLSSSSPFARTTVATGVKFYFTQSRSDQGVRIQSIIPLLNDPDVSVKRQAILALTSLISVQNASLQSDVLLQHLIPSCLKEIQLIPELIRTIDFGAFQETVDEGVPLRHVAHSCLKETIEYFPDHVPCEAMLSALAEHGIIDPDLELQCSAFQLMTAVTDTMTFGLEFFEQLPKYFLPIVKHQLIELKRNPADADVCRILRLFICLVHRLHSLHGVRADCPKFHTFYLQVLKTSTLTDMLREEGIRV